MIPQCIYEQYLKPQRDNDINYYNNLVNFLELLISKNYNQYPLDCEIGINSGNRKQIWYRMLCTFISKNSLHDAARCIVQMIRSYNANYCTIWRAGFHIIRAIGSRKQLDNFFREVMKVNVVDQNNLIYEYMIYLMKMGDYEAVSSLYNEDLIQKRLKCRSKRIIGLERELVPLLIKMTVAVSYYCVWKKSLFSKDLIAANEAAMTSELYFTEIVKLMDQGQPVDNYLENYVDLLLWKEKYLETSRILRLYCDKCPRCVNSWRYLLRFLLQYKENLPEISDKEISDLRVSYVWKMMPIIVTDDQFTLEMLRDCSDQMETESELVSVAAILFELLEHISWSSVEWPWQRLVWCVQIIGVNNDLVQEKWIVRKNYWPDMYSDCEYARSLLTLLEGG